MRFFCWIPSIQWRFLLVRFSNSYFLPGFRWCQFYFIFLKIHKNLLIFILKFTTNWVLQLISACLLDVSKWFKIKMTSKLPLTRHYLHSSYGNNHLLLFSYKKRSIFSWDRATSTSKNLNSWELWSLSRAQIFFALSISWGFFQNWVITSAVKSYHESRLIGYFGRFGSKGNVAYLSREFISKF